VRALFGFLGETLALTLVSRRDESFVPVHCRDKVLKQRVTRLSRFFGAVRPSRHGARFPMDDDGETKNESSSPRPIQPMPAK
jgi:hypothetical protein